MRGFWLLVHVLGFTLWLGGGIATMVAGVTAKRFAPAERLKAYRLIGAIQRLLVGPGAAGVVISGVVLVLSGPYMRSGDMPVWLNVIEVDPRGELPEAFHGLRKRQILAATISGSLGLIALFAATLGRS